MFKHSLAKLFDITGALCLCRGRSKALVNSVMLGTDQT